MTIAITGASGPLGRATAELVLKQVDARDLVLTTRNPEALAEFAAQGVTVRRADFADAQSLPGAFAGVDKLLLVSTDTIGIRLEHQRAAITAAVAAGVRHIAYTSVPEPVPANPALVVSDHAGTEQALRDSGVQWTMLRNNLYAHMQVPTIQQAIASGRLVSNGGDGATAYVSREDCAAAAAGVLTQDGHEGKVYDITGPQAFTAADLAALAADIGGCQVELVVVEDDAAFAAALRDAGVPGEVADVVTSFGASTRGGFLSAVTTAVADLTGQAPVTLQEVVRSAF